jgi:hypothetical protein
VWQLINEGVYNRGSIGFYIEEYDYDEKTDTFFIIKGEVVEGSLVGIPANDMARTVEISKSVREKMIAKSLGLKDHTNNNSLSKKNREAINMDEAEIKALIAKTLADAETSKNAELKSSEEAKRIELETKALNDSLVEKEAKITEFEAELQKSKEAKDKLELEKVELAKALGRISSASNNDKDGDELFLDDKEKALQLGFYKLGKVLQNKTDQTAVFYQSTPVDEMKTLVKIKEGVKV